MKLRTISAVAAALACLISPVLVASPANAASCYYSSCEGKDPQGTGCAADARTIGYVADGGEIRWSRACSAVWVRVSPSGLQWQTRADIIYLNNTGTQWLPDHSAVLANVSNPWGPWSYMTRMGENDMVRVYYHLAYYGYDNTIPIA